MVNVPKLAARKDMTMGPMPRADSSIDPGNPRKKARLM